MSSATAVFLMLQHGFNFVLVLGEMFLNSIPFYPYLLGYVGMWTSFYGIWAFINFSSSGKWMYPVSLQCKLHDAMCITPTAVSNHLTVLTMWHA